jgi:hypothetical protein
MKEQTFNFMTKQEIEDWAKNQDVVKINCIKVGEEDKFVYTIGEFIASPQIFDSQEEAQLYLKKNFKLTNLDLSIIGALCQRLLKIFTQLNESK